MTKTCFRCHQTKPLDEFYRHSMMRDGRLNKCKDCTKADTRRRRRDKHESVLEYDRRRNMQPHRVTARLEYMQTQQGKLAHSKANNAWANKYPERKAASTAINSAKLTGKLAPLPCLICGDPNTEAHHPDYSRPLDVIWLCTAHHKAAHKLAAQLQRNAS
jgi:hypothetical protein